MGLAQSTPVAGTLPGHFFAWGNTSVARKIRSADLETRTARLRFAVRKKPIPVRIGPGIQLTYRRNQQAGRWSVKAADGKGDHWTKGFAYADDFEDADGAAVLNFWQAVDRARLLARNNEGEGDRAVADAGAAERIGARSVRERSASPWRRRRQRQSRASPLIRSAGRQVSQLASGARFAPVPRCSAQERTCSGLSESR